VLNRRAFLKSMAVALAAAVANPVGIGEALITAPVASRATVVSTLGRMTIERQWVPTYGSWLVSAFATLDDGHKYVASEFTDIYDAEVVAPDEEAELMDCLVNAMERREKQVLRGLGVTGIM